VARTESRSALSGVFPAFLQRSRWRPVNQPRAERRRVPRLGCHTDPNGSELSDSQESPTHELTRQTRTSARASVSTKFSATVSVITVGILVSRILRRADDGQGLPALGCSSRHLSKKSEVRNQRSEVRVASRHPMVPRGLYAHFPSTAIFGSRPGWGGRT